MATIQGEFTSIDQAHRAIDALHEAGFTGHHVRMWNVIPEAAPAHGGSYDLPVKTIGGTATAAAAITGFLFGGVPGLLLGALAGGTVTGTFTAGIAMNETSLPAPTGVRVVVDLGQGRGDAGAILSQFGASNLKRVA